MAQVMTEEYFGEYKVYIDSEGTSGKERLGYKVTEYHGQEILDENDKPIQEEDGLWHDREVQIDIEGFGKFRVNKEQNETWIENKHRIAEARYNEDDRHCWVAKSFIDRKAMESIDFTE